MKKAKPETQTQKSGKPDAKPSSIDELLRNQKGIFLGAQSIAEGTHLYNTSPVAGMVLMQYGRSLLPEAIRKEIDPYLHAYQSQAMQMMGVQTGGFATQPKELNYSASSKTASTGNPAYKH